MMDFHMPERTERTRTESAEAKSFDPDRRIDADKSDGSSAEPFNPDERLSETNDSTDTSETATDSENLEASIEKAINDYVEELKAFSEVPDTIPDKPINASELRRVSKEENEEERKAFSDIKVKANLREQWERENGCEWPRYKEDVVNERGIVIRKAGSLYDAHHIKPLCLGGKNEVSNITPLSVEKHNLKEGIHRKGGPCNTLVKLVGERKQ